MRDRPRLGRLAVFIARAAPGLVTALYRGYGGLGRSFIVAQFLSSIQVPLPPLRVIKRQHRALHHRVVILASHISYSRRVSPPSAPHHWTTKFLSRSCSDGKMLAVIGVAGLQIFFS